MKKHILVILMGMFSLVLNAQSKYSIGLSGGLDRSFNSYYSDYYQRYAAFPDYNLALDFGRTFGQKVRLRLEVRYFRVGIGQDWANVDGSSPTTPVKSVKRIFSLGGNLRVDYKILNFSKLEVFLSPAIKAMEPLGSYENTKSFDGKYTTSHYIDPGYRHTLAAGGLGLVVKYNLNPHWGVVLTPEYTYYLRKLYYQCIGNLQTVSVNLGAEWSF